MNLSPFWLRWRVWVVGGGVIVVAVLSLMLVATIRSRAVWKEQARVADSTAKATQKDRARVLGETAAAKALAESLGFAVTRLTRRADSAAAAARDATRDADAGRRARAQASAALAAAASLQDSANALLAKSAADDSVIEAQSRALAAKSEETAGLRSALDSAAAARVALAAGLDSARAQLQRDGVVIQQLQGVIKSARGPAHVARLQPYLEGLVVPNDVKTTVARAGLQVNVTSHFALVGAGEATHMPNHTDSRGLVGVRWNFR